VPTVLKPIRGDANNFSAKAVTNLKLLKLFNLEICEFHADFAKKIAFCRFTEIIFAASHFTDSKM